MPPKNPHSLLWYPWLRVFFFHHSQGSSNKTKTKKRTVTEIVSVDTSFMSASFAADPTALILPLLYKLIWHIEDDKLSENVRATSIFKHNRPSATPSPTLSHIIRLIHSPLWPTGSNISRPPRYVTLGFCCFSSVCSISGHRWGPLAPHKSPLLQNLSTAQLDIEAQRELEVSRTRSGRWSPALLSSDGSLA